jgi:hypothetical protein
LIEEEAFYRLRNYPAQISASLHHACITIPRKLAYILHTRPTAIAPAVEAFYLRDPIALKPLQIASAKLVFPPEDLVTVSVRFTKVLYAQLKSQQFPPPVAWKDLLANPKNGTNSKSYTQLEMGMKVTSGFEILVTDPKNKDNRSVREINILLEDLTSEGDSALPNDDEISEWKDVRREDDESWLDINFEDFERELDGKGREKKPPKPSGVFGPEPPSGFGDAKAEADLKKMVERFEAFLNDEDAGAEGVELDDMDVDDDEDEDDSDDDDDDDSEEDRDVSFDEVEFAKMMREMMGMPPDEADEMRPSAISGKSRQIEELDSDDDEDDEEEEFDAEGIQKVMKRMEAELKEAGALNLDPAPHKTSAAIKGKQPADEKSTARDEAEGGDDSDDEELDIDYNLAKNLLESFKSQGGMAGPGGNLLAMLGMQLPRDEEDDDTGTGPSKKHIE